jgi:hypothetical protein
MGRVYLEVDEVEVVAAEGLFAAEVFAGPFCEMGLSFPAVFWRSGLVTLSGGTSATTSPAFKPFVTSAWS